MTLDDVTRYDSIMISEMLYIDSNITAINVQSDTMKIDVSIIVELTSLVLYM